MYMYINWHLRHGLENEAMYTDESDPCCTSLVREDNNGLINKTIFVIGNDCKYSRSIDEQSNMYNIWYTHLSEVTCVVEVILPCLVSIIVVLRLM